ncbi:MAG: hypothetical protein RLZZ226_795 [Pseudomonadota bacterium]|jgi:Ni,Fe-hydrogenase III large subunit
MKEKEISESLHTLRQAIQEMGTDNQQARQTLENLLDQLESRLQPASEGNPLHLVEDMKQTLTGFEIEHPAITATLNQLMVTLGSMGI